MPSTPLANALQVAWGHHQSGRLPQAEAIYRQVLAADPNQPDALHLLGVIFRNTGKPETAMTLITRAVTQRPNWPEAWHNLGNAARDAGQTDQAISAYRQAIALNGQFFDSYVNLGNLLISKSLFDEATGLFQTAISLRPNDAYAFGNLGNALMGKLELDAAISAYGRALELQPHFHQAMSNLGIALGQKGELDKAIDLHKRAISVCPDYADAYLNLGEARKSLGQYDEAVAAYRRAISLSPGNVAALSGLGDALHDSGRFNESIEAYRLAISSKPGSPEVYTKLGNVLKKIGKFAESVDAHRQALSLKPNFAEAYSNLGSVLTDSWRIDEGIDACRKAIEIKPDFANAYGNLGHALLMGGQLDAAMSAILRVIELEPGNQQAHGGYVFSLNYHPNFDSTAIARELAEWNRRHAQPLSRFITAHSNDRNPNRRLRIGYVSADFWAHPVGRFLLPLLANHDITRVKLFAYSQATVTDSITEELKKFISVWRDCVGLSDSQMAELVRKDQIDILVDLSLHTAGNRLLVFAQKPAPVQLTWLGYPGSTGLKTIDYRLSDPYLDPIRSDESIYSEKTLRFSETFWCYQPNPAIPEVSPLPAAQHGHITFGCLNHFGKVTQQMLRAWIRILQATPGSTLLLHVPTGTARQRVVDAFTLAGISSERVEFEGRMAPEEYFRLYGRMDIALDTSPFAGGTTTCDALWMGVPVITLKGKTVTGRGGFSILSNVGLPELVAESEEDYVQIATTLAGDIARLKQLRSNLRERMNVSPLMDAPRFARNMESAFRTAWQTWCVGHVGVTSS